MWTTDDGHELAEGSYFFNSFVTSASDLLTEVHHAVNHHTKILTAGLVSKPHQYIRLNVLLCHNNNLSSLAKCQ